MIFAMLISVALQAPPAPKPEAAPPPAAAPKAPAPDKSAPRRETLDEQIKRALANHPDLRIAQLQVELAQAKLEQERQKLTQRITTARATRDAAVTSRETAAKLAEMMRKTPGIFLSEASPAEEKLTLAQEKLAVAEAELLAAVGGPPQAPLATLLYDRSNDTYYPEVTYLLSAGVRPVPAWKLPAPAAPNSFAADFARMLDQRITPRKKKGTSRELLTELLTQASGGKPLPFIRLTQLLEPPFGKTYELQGETDTLGAWLQQFSDTVSNPGLGQQYPLYVREYGLLVIPADGAPIGALTVTEFWQRARAEKAAREKMPPAK